MLNAELGDRNRMQCGMNVYSHSAFRIPHYSALALDDHAEVGTDDAQGVAEVDRNEEGLVNVDIADHDAEGNSHQVDVADVDDVAGLVWRGDRPQRQGDGVLVERQVGVALDRRGLRGAVGGRRPRRSSGSAWSRW